MSFSQNAKNDLCGQSIKKRCCKISLLYGMLLFSGTFTENRIKLVTETEAVANLLSGLLHSLTGSISEISRSEKRSGNEISCSYKLTVTNKSDIKNIFSLIGGNAQRINTEILKCQGCAGSFLKGAFLSGGTVSSPKSGYHLDVSTPNAELAAELCEFINTFDLQAKCTERQGRTAVYFKDSEIIQDFLTFIGAQSAALDMMNEKIFKDVRNNENRRSNCETANIYRQTGSSGEQTRAINKIIADGRFNDLPQDLKLTAELRLENPFSSLDELASLHDLPISKSGVNHRLKKIIEFSKNNK